MEHYKCSVSFKYGRLETFVALKVFPVGEYVIVAKRTIRDPNMGMVVVRDLGLLVTCEKVLEWDVKYLPHILRLADHEEVMEYYSDHEIKEDEYEQYLKGVLPGIIHPSFKFVGVELSFNRNVLVVWYHQDEEVNWDDIKISVRGTINAIRDSLEDGMPFVLVKKFDKKKMRLY